MDNECGWTILGGLPTVNPLADQNGNMRKRLNGRPHTNFLDECFSCLVAQLYTARTSRLILMLVG
jgi:hypothetical protein